MQFGCTRDRNDPRLLCKEPGQRDLSGCCLLLFRELAEQIHQRLVRFPVLRGKPRHDVAEIGFVELRIFVDLACEEALAEGAEWNEPDSELLERW